jgi:hypothetical protein
METKNLTSIDSELAISEKFVAFPFPNRSHVGQAWFEICFINLFFAIVKLPPRAKSVSPESFYMAKALSDCCHWGLFYDCGVARCRECGKASVLDSGFIDIQVDDDWDHTLWPGDRQQMHNLLVYWLFISTNPLDAIMLSFEILERIDK